MQNTTEETKVQVWVFESVELRTVAINGETWWVAADVCRALEHTNTSQAVNSLVDDDEKGYNLVYTPGGPQKLLVVSESGLYALTFGSKAAGARKFRKWVTHEVLPAIRKTGMYVSPEVLEQIEEETPTLHELLRSSLMNGMPTQEHLRQCKNLLDGAEKLFYGELVAVSQSLPVEEKKRSADAEKVFHVMNEYYAAGRRQMNAYTLKTYANIDLDRVKQAVYELEREGLVERYFTAYQGKQVVRYKLTHPEGVFGVKSRVKPLPEE